MAVIFGCLAPAPVLLSGNTEHIHMTGDEAAGQADFFVVMTGVVAHFGQPDCVSKSHGLALVKDILSSVGVRLKGLRAQSH